MRRFLSLWMAVILVAAGLVAAAPAVVSADPTYMCFPSCNETDGRFLILAGTGLSTLSGDTIYIELSSPADAASIEIGIFDGDTGGTWDMDNDTGPVLDEIIFELYADPKADGSGTTMLNSWSGSLMTDKAWYTISFPNDSRALAPSGHYFYGLHARTVKLGFDVWSAFKLRTDGVVMMSPQAFAFMAPLSSGKEGYILYPNAASGDLMTTTYDGTWDLYIKLFESAKEITFWDGDFDRGSIDNSGLDTDDPDTPGAPWLPDWASGTEAVPEGIATVDPAECRTVASATGCPADDREAGVFKRQPAVAYSLVTPDSVVFANDNPSGNTEWEQFRISNAEFNRNEMDYHVDGLLPPGIYHVRAEGVDLSNLNAWRFNHWVSSTPFDPPQPYLIGDYVWRDIDGEGDQDEVDAGIANVLMNLLDSNGVLISTTSTDASGLYTFEVPAGTFTVQVDASNFDVGGPLEDLTSTTGGESQINTVVDANIMTYDFGYRPTGQGGLLGALGDYVWLDANGNGIQDDGPDAGLAGVMVELWSDTDDNGLLDFVDSVGTDDTGYYAFQMLGPATYQVRVDASTLPANLQQTYDLDGLTTPNAASLDLGLGEENWNVDFGYVPPEDICLQGVTDPTRVGAHILYWVNQAAGAVTIRTTLARTFEDTAYGANSKITGWPGGGRKFKQIVTSDNLELTLYDGAGRVAMRFAMDLLHDDPNAPSGYGTLGVLGGDGFMAVGNAGDVLQVRTSIDENLNGLGWRDFVNSPRVNADYTGSALPEWDWDLWYEATVDLSAFGASGFGSPAVFGLHSSPSKTGDMTPPLEPCETITALQLSAAKHSSKR